MTFDNSNRKNIREAEKAEKLANANRIAYTKIIMSDIFGRAWMYDLLERCCMFHSPMAVGFPDATAWNIGKQDIGRLLYNDVTGNCPHEYSLMITEASIKDEANGRRYESSNDADGSTSPGRNGNPAQSGQYGTDQDGFVTDQSEPATDRIWEEGWGPEGHGQQVYDRQ